MRRAAVSMAFVMCVAGAATIVGAEEHPGGSVIQGPIGPPLFTQCPPVGADTGCGTLITITAGGTVTTQADPGQPPYDDSEDQLIGIQNNFHSPICSITIHGSDLFGFDGDGLCTQTPQPAGCPFGPTGYEGPGTSFEVVDSDNGTVVFTPCLAPGKSAYFSLEEPGLGDVTFPAINSGSSPAPAMGPLALGVLGVGLATAGAARARRRKAR